METIIKKASRQALEEAGAVIRSGGLVAFPTETVYGLGGNALDSKASEKIYRAKGRPSDNPLIVHIASIEEADNIAADISPGARKLMERFWPGPLTIVLNRKEAVPYETTGGLDTVAVRMPDHPAALGLIRAAGVPVAAPSANTSGRPSPTAAEHVAEDMAGRIDMILDGGRVDIGIESTIVDMTGERPVILRPGYITKEMLETLLGSVEVDRAVKARGEEELKAPGYAPKAPGMKYRHYAPKAGLIMFEGEAEKVYKEINKRADSILKAGKRAGIICTDESLDRYPSKIHTVKSAGKREDGESIAHNLYFLLREFDKTDVDIILSESFYDTGLGQAIMNRLIKAAGYHIETVR